MSFKSRFIWRFPPSKFVDLPSSDKNKLKETRLDPLSFDEELRQRQSLSMFIYELGSNLQVSFDSILTGVIYMHRFFMVHPMQKFDKQFIAGSCLFLSCKVNDNARTKFELVRQIARLVKPNESNSTDKLLSGKAEQMIVEYENLLLSTLGFSLDIDQPYRIIKSTVQHFSMPKEIVVRATDLASKSLFFTLFSVKYTNNLIACFAIYFALKSSRMTMCDNADGTQWFHFLNEEFTERRLQELVDEFLSVSIDKETILLQQRFDQMHRGLKPTSSNENSVRHSPSKEPTSTDSLALRETNDENETRLDHLSTGPTETRQLSERTNSIESTNHCHVKASLANQSSVDCSPLKSSARPIPTVMSSIASQQLVNVHGFRHQSRIMPGTFCYAASPNAFHHYFRPQYGSISTQNLQNSQFYRTDVYIPPVNFYSQCQTPIIEYNLAERVNKRYSEPPSAPIKRIKPSFNVNPPY